MNELVLVPGSFGRSSANRPTLLETLATINWPALRRLERHSRFLAALGTDSLGLDALDARRGRTCRTLGANRFTSLASLRFVFEALVGEKHLFAGGEYKFRTAFRTFQDLIVVFHGPLRGVASTSSNTLRPEPDHAGICWGSLILPPADLKKAKRNEA
ncbi:MAG TPA: hypothetical protein VGR81_03785 [Candidatus Acidoferrales bacterium]|nr:hypothetical protein [Candidatus Acidoferrales bacterium]